MIYLDKGAILDASSIYRYVLWRKWNYSAGEVMFIGLNPSTADASIDDNTIRRCVNFANSWGYGSLYMLNLFAFRSTDPDVLKTAQDPIGPKNNDYLVNYSMQCDQIVVAWGSHYSAIERAQIVIPMLRNPIKCLGKTKTGHPRHPLYMPSSAVPIPLS